ncbi:MAG: phosphate ABC transporter permease subunit PstC [Christensenellales bacterium]|jgi:phosphate transport system permease protein
MNRTSQKIIEALFLLSAVISVVALGLILWFILMKGVPALREIGIWEFISGDLWMPSAELFGILPMIVSSILVTMGAVIVGAPISILAALFLTQLAPKKLADAAQVVIELLAAIPSVVYGFFGLTLIVPTIDRWSGGYGGNSLLAGIIILAMMILPTIISVSSTSLKAVPEEYKDASLALGESITGTSYRVMLPAAKTGVFTAIVLGVGRAVGETMAVILVMGNTPRMPDFLNKGLTAFFQPTRTLTGNIAIEMGYATGLHEGALFATATVLLVFIVIINLTLWWIQKKAGSVK